MKNFKESMIGKKLYPVDNSQSFNIRTKEKAYLAGTSETRAKLVEIVSNPYHMEYEFCGTQKCEFVTVKYGDELYIVMNHFSKEPKDREFYNQ